ncbi:apolipoprotein N-acyltransferase [Thioalkalivibrio sp. HK1]|uniref:apolipoprotein N-acyltransferase n=1 Tax=Thioalkalivibrio sp. HK1 TaxID=1469245 RepID=UPI001E63486F|nr:apolipoprotein N-acyltransferase [Thioalkalivibrio sp. HK1]
MAGAAMPFAFAPFHLFPLAPLALAALFLAWHDGSGIRRAFLRGWLFGLGMFGIGLSWVRESFAFSDVPEVVSPVLALGFVALVSLFPALLGALISLATKTKDGSSKRIAGASFLLGVCPASWTLWEWLRGTLFTGLPWLQVGYSQIDTPAAPWLPLVGIHGVGILVALLAGGIAWLFLRRSIGAVLWPVGAAILLWGGGAALSPIEWTRPAGSPIEVAIAQGNIAQDQKWLAQMRAPTIDRYFDLTRRYPQADLVVWPETALPGFLDNLSDFMERARADPSLQKRTILTGMLVRERSASGADLRYFNSAMTIGADRAIYHKRHLVPFGEYIPLAWLVRPVMNALGIRLADFEPGAEDQTPLRLGDHAFGVSICYEIAFAKEVRRSLPEAAFLVTISNDAWFGDSIGPHQHFEIARARAIESGRWLVRSANTGISAVVSPAGEVAGILPQFEVAAESFEIVPMRGATPYVKIGDIPALILAAIGLLSGLSRFRFDWKTPSASDLQGA